jgi:hypothetical protein
MKGSSDKLKRSHGQNGGDELDPRIPRRRRTERSREIPAKPPISSSSIYLGDMLIVTLLVMWTVAYVIDSHVCVSEPQLLSVIWR